MRGFVVLLVILPAWAFAVCSNTKQLELCYNTYLEDYEMSADPFPGYRTFKTLREMMLVEEGPSGQIKECGFQNGLIGCLGDLASDCINVDAFQLTFGKNLTHSDALLYVQDYFMMKYTCGDGYNDALKYFYCMEQVGLYYPSRLEECSQKEQEQLQNGGGCPVYNDFVTCMSNVFTEYCGADIRNYICNLESKGISGAVPSCANSLQDCSKPAPGSFSSKNIGKAMPRILGNRKRQMALRILNHKLHIFP